MRRGVRIAPYAREGVTWHSAQRTVRKHSVRQLAVTLLEPLTLAGACAAAAAATSRA